MHYIAIFIGVVAAIMCYLAGLLHESRWSTPINLIGAVLVQVALRVYGA